MDSHRVVLAVALLVVLSLSVGAALAQDTPAPPADPGAGDAPDPGMAPDGVGMAVPPTDAPAGTFEDGGFPTTTLVIVAIVIAVIAIVAAGLLKKKS